MIIMLAFLIGIVAGLRAMTAPAAVAWAAALGWFDVSQTPLAFMGYRWTPWIFTVFAIAELVSDQLPSTPSRKVPLQFGARIVMGALAGQRSVQPAVLSLQPDSRDHWCCGRNVRRGGSARQACSDVWQRLASGTNRRRSRCRGRVPDCRELVLRNFDATGKTAAPIERKFVGGNHADPAGGEARSMDGGNSGCEF